MHFDAAEIAYVPTTGVSRVHETPLVEATDDTLQGYGCLVDEPQSFAIEIVRWPAQGWRAIDENSGDQGGVTEGVFEFWWKGETLYARNNAVGDSYLFAWSNWPEEAATEVRQNRGNERSSGAPITTPTAASCFIRCMARVSSCRSPCRGDDVTPKQLVTFWCDGSRGLYIRPNIWHGAIVPLDDDAELLDRQGRVHARVSVDFAKEFGCYLGVPTQRRDR